MRAGPTGWTATWRCPTVPGRIPPSSSSNDQRESYREKEATDAWAKTLAFFERHLR
ncbi:MAG TPA: hypothetical protein VJB36_02075 [Methylomirabilota bacterium]|nr:hypothetical protein [Methylomirabilota bacterium]